MTILERLREVCEEWKTGKYPTDEAIEDVFHGLPKLLDIAHAANEYFNDPGWGEYNPKYFPKRAAVIKALEANTELTLDDLKKAIEPAKRKGCNIFQGEESEIDD